MKIAGQRGRRRESERGDRIRERRDKDEGEAPGRKWRGRGVKKNHSLFRKTSTLYLNKEIKILIKTDMHMHTHEDTTHRTMVWVRN